MNNTDDSGFGKDMWCGNQDLAKASKIKKEPCNKTVENDPNFSIKHLASYFVVMKSRVAPKLESFENTESLTSHKKHVRENEVET